jgi:hypothetical protein
VRVEARHSPLGRLPMAFCPPPSSTRPLNMVFPNPPFSAKVLRQSRDARCKGALRTGVCTRSTRPLHSNWSQTKKRRKWVVSVEMKSVSFAFRRVPPRSAAFFGGLIFFMGSLRMVTMGSSQNNFAHSGLVFWPLASLLAPYRPMGRVCSSLARGLPKPDTSQFPQTRRTLRDPWCQRPKSLRHKRQLYFG